MGFEEVIKRARLAVDREAAESAAHVAESETKDESRRRALESELETLQSDLGHLATDLNASDVQPSLAFWSTNTRPLPADLRIASYSEPSRAGGPPFLGWILRAGSGSSRMWVMLSSSGVAWIVNSQAIKAVDYVALTKDHDPTRWRAVRRLRSTLKPDGEMYIEIQRPISRIWMADGSQLFPRGFIALSPPDPDLVDLLEWSLELAEDGQTVSYRLSKESDRSRAPGETISRAALIDRLIEDLVAAQAPFG